MTNTPDLIDTLVASAVPVRRLRPPLLRAALWLAFAMLVFAIIAVAHGLRSDITVKLQQPVFVIGMAGALATGILAAVAAFRISLPDSSRWWFLLPAPALVLWVSTIGYGCLTDWVNVGPQGIRLGEAAQCFATLLLTSIPLSIAMLVMLRYAAFLRPTAVSAAGAVAVAALTAFTLSLVHNFDASIMILMWNLGVALLITAIGSLAGRTLLLQVASWLRS